MSYIGNTNTTQAFTPAIDYFSGNGSTTAFTLSRPVASVAQVQVVIDNVAQNPSSAYSVSSNTITFTSAPLSGTNNIYVYYTSPITQVIAPGQGTVTATSMASSTGTGAGVFQTSPTITTPVISSLSSAAATALTLQSAGTTAVTIDTSQRVGVGTASPSSNARLTVSGTTGSGTGSGILITGSGYQTSPTGMVLGQYDATTFYIQRPASSSFEIWDSATNGQLKVDASGNVLVGLTAQRVTEKFNATATSAESRDDVAVIENLSNTTGKNGLRVFIGSGGNNTSTWHFRGETRGVANSYLYGNGTTSYSSDSRLKKNIVTTRNGYLEDLNKLRVVKYQWIGDNPNCQQVELGLIAQEVEEVFPNLVQEHEIEGVGMRKNIKKSVLPFMMLKAIQELKAINDTQAETINALTARIEALENR